MSIILKRVTQDAWPEFGKTIMDVLKFVSIVLESFFGGFIAILALVSLIAVPILIVIFSIFLYKQWCDRNQPKQSGDEEVVMGRIISGGNEQDVEYGVVGTDNAVEEVAEHKEGIDG